jgi:hypothetical protein
MKQALMMLLALATACTADDDDDPAQNDDESTEAVADDDSDGSSSDGSADESSTGVDVDALWDCNETMLLEARPLVGPGYDAEMGGLLEPLQDTYVVATTKVFVPPQKQEDFLGLADTVTLELDATPGMVAYGLSFESTCGFFRTLSVYRSEEEMYGFVLSDPHAVAMSRYSELVTTGKTTSWVLPADEFPPTWAMADDHLDPISPH